MICNPMDGIRYTLPRYYTTILYNTMLAASTMVLHRLHRVVNRNDNYNNAIQIELNAIQLVYFNKMLNLSLTALHGTRLMTERIIS